MNRNRVAGNGYECDIVKDLKALGLKDVATCRSCNRKRDGEGIDLTHADEARYGRFFLDIQTKKAMSVPIHKIFQRLTRATGRIQVLLWARIVKKGARFYTDEEYAVLRKDDFYKLLDAYLKQHPKHITIYDSTD